MEEIKRRKAKMDKVYRCAVCTLPFHPTKADNKYCTYECQQIYQLDREKKLKMLRKVLVNSNLLEDARKTVGLPPKEFYELIEIITRKGVDVMPLGKEYNWTSHKRIKEMDILGKYKIKREWRLPNVPVGINDSLTIEQFVIKEKNK